MPSDTWVKSTVIYWVYRNWCGDVGVKTKSRYEFFPELKRLGFTMDRSWKCNTFNVNSEPFVLDPEDERQMYRYYDKQTRLQQQKRHSEQKKKK